MIIYYYDEFDSVDDAVIASMVQQMPQQQAELVTSRKMLSQKREQAVSFAMLAYALANNKEEATSRDLFIRHFPFAELIASLSVLDAPIHFRFGDKGKPYLVENNDIWFNISHCREAIVTAVSNREVGVDAEGRRRYSDHLLERCYSEQERQSVHDSADSENEFARIWTRKEAFFKWTGTGILTDHIKTVEEDAKRAGCAIETLEVTKNDGNSFFLSIAE